MKKKIIYFIMLLWLLSFAGGCRGAEKETAFWAQEEKRDALQKDSRSSAGEVQTGKEKTAEEDGAAGGEESLKDQTIYVQVSGAVKCPGVYQLEAGSRIFQAVELAGGVTESADISSLNQAEVLQDGQMIYVLRQGEVRASQTEEAEEEKDGKVNLNTAAEAELMTLPGIGASKARSIIAWREEHGGFRQIEDLMKIEGIKEGVFSKIKDSVKVD